MASSSSTIIERGAEPAAPILPPVKSDAFPDAALGIVREPVAADPGEGTPTGEGASAEPVQAPERTSANGTGTDVAGDGGKPATGGGSPITADSWDAIKQRPEYQADVATALNKQRDRMKAELEEANASKARLAELEEAQAQYDNLLQRADDASDPIAQAEAQAQLTSHIRTQRLNEQIAVKIRPALETAAAATVAGRILGQYEEAFKELEPVLGKTLLDTLHPTKFEHGGEWVKQLVSEVGAKAAIEAVAAYKRDDMEKEVKVRVAEQMARFRAGMPQTDLIEGTGGGQNPDGVFNSEEDVHDAIAAGLVTPSRGRAILQQQFGRKFK